MSPGLTWRYILEDHDHIFVWALCLWKHLEQDRILIQECPRLFTPSVDRRCLPTAPCCLLCILQPASSSTSAHLMPLRCSFSCVPTIVGVQSKPLPHHLAFRAPLTTAASCFAPATCTFYSVPMQGAVGTATPPQLSFVEEACPRSRRRASQARVLLSVAPTEDLLSSSSPAPSTVAAHCPAHALPELPIIPRRP